MFQRNRMLLCASAIVLLSNLTVMSATYAAPPLPLISVSLAVPAGKILIPDATPVKLLLDQELKSGSCHEGDHIDYELENDWYAADRQLIAPAGTKAVGHVISSSGHGMFGKPGKLEISVDYIIAPDRTHIVLRGNRAGGGGKNEVGGMVAVMVFASLLGGMFIEGRDVNLHKGMEIPMYVDGDQVTTPYMTILAQAGLGPNGNPVPAPQLQTLYIMHDGTQIIGTQNADDGTNYAVTTSAGLKLIPHTSVKSTYQVTAPTAKPTPALVAVAATSAPVPIIYAFTLIDGSKYYGTLVTNDTTVPDGFTKISNSVGTRLIKNSSITTQVAIADETTAQSQGFKE